MNIKLLVLVIAINMCNVLSTNNKNWYPEILNVNLDIRQPEIIDPASTFGQARIGTGIYAVNGTIITLKPIGSGYTVSNRLKGYRIT